MNKMLKKYTLFLLILVLLAPIAGLEAEETFNPNFIIDDTEINDYNSMTLSDIQTFLTDRGGYLASYRTAGCTDEDVMMQRSCTGPVISAAEIIYSRALATRVNPKFFLVLLQKEQSLIEKTAPTQNQLDWAVGYGCFDGLACNPRWQGFWKQINSAGLQFRDYMDSPHLYNYKIGQTYTIYNTGREASVVTPYNQATCALYNYTPHVYWGNFNFYNIWQRYFIRSYPNGTLLQVSGEPGVWLLQNGKKRPFASRGALTSRYDINRVITVSKTDLDKYDKGAPITFPQYSIVRSPLGGLYLLVDDTRRGFTSSEAFKKMGFNPEEIVDGSWEELSAYTEVAPITASSTNTTGSLLQDKVTGGVYWVIDGKKAPIVDRIFLKTLFKNKKIKATAPSVLAAYTTVDPVRFGDGELIKGQNSSAVYVIADGNKRAINSAKVFEGLKYSWKNIIVVPDRILYLYPDGEPMKEQVTNNDAVSLTANEVVSTSSTITPIIN